MESSDMAMDRGSLLEELRPPPLPDDLQGCEGLPRYQWITKPVLLRNRSGVPVAKGVCHSVDPTLVVGANGPLADHQIAVQIISSLSEEDVPGTWEWSMRTWEIEFALYGGFSLQDHERRDSYNIALKEWERPRRDGVRPYDYSVRSRAPIRNTKAQLKLFAVAINLVSSQVCCKLNCVQPFPREKIAILRDQMWNSTDFKFRNHLKLDVHRQTRTDQSGRKLITLEGFDVCQRAWMHILGVPKTTFYNKMKHIHIGMRADHHGNLGLKKPREHTLQATATLKNILEVSADHMPHKSTSMASGEKVVSMSLPANWKWNAQLPHVNEVNNQLGLPPISQSSLAKIRAEEFPEYSKKAPGDNFARCAACDNLKVMKSTTPIGSQLWMLYERKLNRHCASQKAHRILYYGNRDHSISHPRDCLTIIHDKMDHAKTASPVFSHKTKSNDVWMKLPIQVAGMIAHGHADVKYAHFGLDYHPHDSNACAGSIMKLLRNLEAEPKYSSRVLFDGSGSHLAYKAILQGSDMCFASLPPSPSSPAEAMPLPAILHMQMDNAPSDNKNRYMFCLWSLLVARRVFREIHLNFMLVGHTHDDIDALFGRWSMKLRQNDYPTVPLLMKSFMDLESQPVIPHLVEEVPDWKGFIEGYIASRPERLVGHSDGQQFKFFMNSKGWPIMQYKILCTDSDWLPVEGIKLWREDESGAPMLPTGELKALPPQPLKNKAEIIKGIGGFISHWKRLLEEDLSGEYRRKHGHLISYWEGVQVALTDDITPSIGLRDGFWPKSMITPSIQDQFMENGDIREEYDEDEAYFGRSCDRPLRSFCVGRDIYAGYFLIIRPADEDPKPFWIARALTGFNTNRDHPYCIQVQYYMPTSRSIAVQETYSGWDTRKSFKWKVDEEQPPEWCHSECIISAWKSSAKEGRRGTTPVIAITAEQIGIIQSTLLRVNDDNMPDLDNSM